MSDPIEVEVRFDDLYVPFLTVGFDDSPAQKSYIGSKEKRVCRFCRRAAPDVSFKDEAHVIPAALGNKHFFSYEECRECNQSGSGPEDELSKYLALERAFARKWSRGGNKMKALPEESTIESFPETNEVVIKLCDGDVKIRTERREGNKLRIYGHRPKFSPMGMAKALMRMALFYMGDDIPTTAPMFAWIRGEREWRPTWLRGFVPGAGGLRFTTLTIFKLREPQPGYADFVVQLCYSTALLMTFSPDVNLAEPTEFLVPEPGVSPNVPVSCRFTEPPKRVEKDGKLPASEVWFELGYSDVQPIPVEPEDDCR